MVLKDLYPSLLARLVGKTPVRKSISFSDDATLKSDGELDRWRRTLADAAATRNAEAVLTAFQSLELASRPVYAFPWGIWAGMRSAIADEDRLWDLEIGEPGDLTAFKADILEQSRRIRLEEPDLSGLAGLFANAENVQRHLSKLSMPWLVELAAMGFGEKVWPLMQAIGAEGLSRPRDNTVDGSLADWREELLFETHTRAVMRAQVHDYPKDPERVLGALERTVKREGWARVMARDCPARHGFDGLMLAMRGRLEESFEAFAAVRASDGFQSTIFESNAIIFPYEKLKAVDLVSKRREYGRAITHSHHFRHDPSGQHGTLVSADQRYFKAFAQAYMQLFRQFNDTGLVHFLLVNMEESDAELHALFDAWEAETGIAINFTREDNKIARDMTKHIEGMAIVTRHLYLGRILEHYSALTLSDVDGVVNRPQADCHAFEGNDIILHSQMWKLTKGRYFRYPFSTLMGGCMAMNNTARTRQYLQMLERYLYLSSDYCLDRDVRLVNTDQAAHFVCAFMGQKYEGLMVKFESVKFVSHTDLRHHTRMELKQQAMEQMVKDGVELPPSSKAD